MKLTAVLPKSQILARQCSSVLFKFGTNCFIKKSLLAICNSSRHIRGVALERESVLHLQVEGGSLTCQISEIENRQESKRQGYN